MKFQKFLNEGTTKLSSMLNPPRERRIANVVFVWDNKPNSFNTRDLKSDGWFRSEKTNAGVMFRSVKLLSKQDHTFPSHFVQKISFQYYPLEYTTSPGFGGGGGTYTDKEDEKKNWKRDTGYLLVSNHQDMPTMEEVVAWMNQQAKRDIWVP